MGFSFVTLFTMLFFPSVHGGFIISAFLPFTDFAVTIFTFRRIDKAFIASFFPLFWAFFF